MAESNVDLVRRGMDAVARRDLTALEQLCDPRVEVDWSKRLLDPQVLHGIEGFRSFFDDVDSIFERVAVDEEEVVDFGDQVLVVSTASFRGRHSGVDVQAQGAFVWTVRDGKLARFCFYQSKEDALADLGPVPIDRASSS
jgi:ketosteroid isomerase-like protein